MAKSYYKKKNSQATKFAEQDTDKKIYGLSLAVDTEVFSEIIANADQYADLDKVGGLDRLLRYIISKYNFQMLAGETLENIKRDITKVFTEKLNVRVDYIDFDLNTGMFKVHTF